jgi:hypothetical protein
VFTRGVEGVARKPRKTGATFNTCQRTSLPSQKVVLPEIETSLIGQGDTRILTTSDVPIHPFLSITEFNNHLILKQTTAKLKHPYFINI